ncbi:beta-ribofuranosylaminobenzene 5'-phosphate synthase family protein [Shewanella frigidimarina]|uniref:Beta-ribofuranosylaminobenzene 5'-phosphate synthase family protein n=1 Tax=Shewanella frigidimarina (strain NCIMB 400) TaxID=318167 RepID=Q07YD5_SHEFN|nr:beta-ribofuranosylaminobenzene 5'-phosphate synthase family protein [Shewanella frigidimarina]ABI72979.1 beta-ribofuranosylaminobenzene 5'-phosphate synthase family protein [Shewanella frigidimarina NCIMB 400]
MQNGLNTKVKIKIPFRLHFNLIAMHECNFRKNGGVGLSVDTECQAEFIPNNELEIVIHDFCNKQGKIEKIKNKLLDFMKSTPKIKIYPTINISGNIFFNSGLGAGTSILLTCIEGILLINNIPYTETDIQSISGRGGTSGVGINSYFRGGFIFDSGTVNDNKKHKPSGDNTPKSLPLLINSNKFPSWNLGLIIPKLNHNNYGKFEENFFDVNCPIAKNDAYEACYISVFGILSSVISENYKSFCMSINNTQNTKWKKLEIEFAGEPVIKLIENLKKSGADAVGMSSLGPGVYFFSKEPELVFDKIKSLGDYLYINIHPCNSGREIYCV